MDHCLVPAFEHKMAAELTMWQRRSSLQVGSNQAVTLLVGSTVFVAAHSLRTCACMLVCSQFVHVFFCRGRTASKSDTNSPLIASKFDLLPEEFILQGESGRGGSEGAKLEGDTPTWRRKRAFILRSNHGSSWYAGKLKGGRGGRAEALESSCVY